MSSNANPAFQAAAPSGGVLVGETTYRATRDRIDYAEHEPVTHAEVAAAIDAAYGAPVDKAVVLWHGLDHAPLLLSIVTLALGAALYLRWHEFRRVTGFAEALSQRLGSRRPVLGLYIDCGGRVAAFAGTEREEARSSR